MKNKRKNIVGKELTTMLKKAIDYKGLKVDDIIEIFSFDEEFSSNIEAVNELRQSNLIHVPPYNRCLFIDGNSAKIEKILNRDMDGEEDEEDETYTFYYKSWNQDTQFRLDILGAYRAFSNKTYSEMMSEMMEDYGMDTEEENWKAIEKARYRKNIEMLEDNGEWISDRPNLYKVVKSSLKTLRFLNVIAVENMASMREQINGQSVFFASGSYIANKSKESKTAVVFHINLLTALGIIRKPKLEELPEMVGSVSEKLRLKSGFKTTINYFIVESLDAEILDRAEAIAAELKEKAVDINHITMEKVEEALGKAATDNIYGNNSNNTALSIKGAQKRRMEQVNPEELKKELEEANEKIREMPMRIKR